MERVMTIPTRLTGARHGTTFRAAGRAGMGFLPLLALLVIALMLGLGWAMFGDLTPDLQG